MQVSYPRGALWHQVERIRNYLPEGRALPHDLWLRRHKVIVKMLWLHVAGIAAFGVIAGYNVGHSVLEGLAVAIPALLASWANLAPRLRTLAATLGLLTASAVLVHLAGGSTEMHFHFFVMIGVITVYQDWLPFLLGIGFVATHHAVMGVIDPSSVFNHEAAQNNPLLWAAIHAIFILAASAAYLVSWRLSEIERTRAEFYSLRHHEAQLRQRQAIEINDSIIQGLVVAETAIACDEAALTKEALAATLVAARQIVTDLLHDAETESRLGPGDLRRVGAALIGTTVT